MISSSTPDQQHADAHPSAERNGVDARTASPRGSRTRSRVGVGVHTDAEPRHAVAAEDADHAEERMIDSVTATRHRAGSGLSHP